MRSYCITLTFFLFSFAPWLLSGCGKAPTPPQSVTQPTTKSDEAIVAQKRVPDERKPVAAKEPPAQESKQPAAERHAPKQPPRRTLADLVEQGKAEEPAELDPNRFAKLELNLEKLAARKIRAITGKHLTLYTDIPEDPEIDHFADVFDAAVPQWCEFFGVDPKRAESWKITAFLAREKERFYETGAWPEDLPPFLHGYMRDSNFWLYEQPSDYYRRHLLLHEGTHAFMWAFFGGLGSAWYSEGTAEYLATHSWKEGKLRLGVMPARREETPMWGRIKIVRDAWKASQGKSLREVIDLPPGAFLKTEPYGWAWAGSSFFAADPRFRQAYRDAHLDAADSGATFAERFINRLGPQARGLGQQWQWYLANLDFGYDIARESFVMTNETSELPASGGEFQLAIDRGWQSTGYRVPAGCVISIAAASDRYCIAKTDVEWPCEAEGVTIRYHAGIPLGRLLAVVAEEDDSPDPSPFLKPFSVGSGGEVPARKAGLIYLRVNDAPNELFDNSGSLRVKISLKP